MKKALTFLLMVITVCFLTEHTLAQTQPKEVISIEGTILMLNDITPHVAVPVQAIRDGKVIAGVLTDENGKYRFINLNPGVYQVRCYIPGEYVYYGQVREAIPRIGESELARGQKNKETSHVIRNTQSGKLLKVESNKTLSNINFRFPPFKKGTWKHYYTSDGLASMSVKTIYQAPDSTMWFGTAFFAVGSGVSHFDGENFVTFTTKDGLVHNAVQYICCDPDGIMWFATSGGVSRYDGEKFITFTTEDGLAGNSCDAIHSTSDGALWFATSGGVSRYDGEKFITFTTEDGLASNYVYAIHSTSDGALWFGTWGGVSRYDGKEFKNFTTKDGLANGSVSAIHSTPDGAIWFGTGGGGVSCYDGEKFITFTTKDGLVNNIVTDIASDRNGVLWFGTYGGISRYDGSGFINFTKGGRLEVQSIYCDTDGLIWVGTRSRLVGVYQYDERTFINFTMDDGLVDNQISDIHNAPDGILWFGTYGGGVSRYDGKNFVNLTTKDGLADNYVGVIHSDSDGKLWFGTGGYTRFPGSGVIRYDPSAEQTGGKRFTNFTTKDGLSGDVVLDIHAAPDGALWFGTWTVDRVSGGGVSRYDGKRIANLTAEIGLNVYIMDAIHIAPDGTLWFGTDYNGVFRYDGKELINFTTKDGLVSNTVPDIYGAQDGTLWFATYNGISKYDGERFVNFTTEDGLTANMMYTIYCDPDGVLWFGGEGGVSGYDGVAWTSLGTEDGLAHNMVSAIEQDSEGNFWFGNMKGLTQYRRTKTKPKVRIVSVQTDRDYTEDNFRGLSQHSIIPTITTGRRVTIGYSAIDFKTIPEKRQYRCRIQEVDDSWRRPTKSNIFDHTFKKPGDYNFEVQAIDRDLNYSEPASLTLKVVLPFYMRTSFLVPTIGFITILIAVLSIVSIGYIKRRRQVQAYQQEAVRELQDANQVQMGLMPKTAPEIEGIEIAGKCLPANTVSGDFFDYLTGTEENEIALVVADVTGKAMKGAMNAVMADGVLRATAKAQKQLSPASLMAELNDVLKGSMEWGMNITMVIGVIHRNRGRAQGPPLRVSEGEITLTLANAAHHAHPLLLRRSQTFLEGKGFERENPRLSLHGEIQTLKTGGLPLGMRAGIQYSEEQFPLQSGDVVILMTDGIIEAMDSEEKQYSESGRLERAISQFTLDMPAEAMVEAVIADAIDFGGEKATRDDDMTVIVAKIL
ncbi:SpoIIE family protein phosphatase [bacterium]|nr:SpoIIE family protein phosphatase [bacterium]